MEYTKTFFNSANESNPEGELAVNILVANIIEIATAHANSLGIGNPAMAHLGAGWVLSRLTVEMNKYPACNTSYVIRTWVESWNRHFSVRDFSVETEDGKILGYARSVWMVLDMKTHDNYGLSHLTLPDGSYSDRECPIAPQSKHAEIMPYGTPEDTIPAKALRATVPDSVYTFKYNDIDFYRHVNTVRYITILLNRYSLDDFDANFVRRLEVSFLHEGNFGDTVDIRCHRSSDLDSSYSLISHKTGMPVIFARISLSPRD